MDAAISLNELMWDYSVVDRRTGRLGFIGFPVPSILDMMSPAIFTCRGGDECDCNFCEEDDGDSDLPLG